MKVACFFSQQRQRRRICCDGPGQGSGSARPFMPAPRPTGVGFAQPAGDIAAIAMQRGAL